MLEVYINTLYSGGAEGADTIFSECAQKNGHSVVNYSFPGHFNNCDIGKVLLTDKELLVADPFLKKANKVLKRTFPTTKIYVNELLRRNYYQIKDSDNLYAVSNIVDNKVLGGTAWAVTMFLQKNPEKFCYIYDMITNYWWAYSLSNIKLLLTIPKPENKYTGIGSRVLSNQGILAIKKLYE